jgi:hypothetical protein
LILAHCAKIVCVFSAILAKSDETSCTYGGENEVCVQFFELKRKHRSTTTKEIDFYAVAAAQIITNMTRSLRSFGLLSD